MPPAKQPPKHRQCGVQSATERLYEQDPNLRGRHRRIEDECQNLIAKGYAQRVWRKLSTIQVVVHVVSKTDEEDISDEQIESQIDVLNQDYRKTNADASKIPDPWVSLAADPNIRSTWPTSRAPRPRSTSSAPTTASSRRPAAACRRGRPTAPQHLGLQPRRRPARLRAVPRRPGRRPTAS